MKYASAYLKGAAEALDSFGIRVASDSTHQRMPDGPEHLGAEWLSRQLRQDNEDYTTTVGSRPSHRKLEKPTTWGSPSSLEGSGANAHNHAGAGVYGGV